jgi:hypothetical protein
MNMIGTDVLTPSTPASVRLLIPFQLDVKRKAPGIADICVLLKVFDRSEHRGLCKTTVTLGPGRHPPTQDVNSEMLTLLLR